MFTTKHNSEEEVRLCVNSHQVLSFEEAAQPCVNSYRNQVGSPLVTTNLHPLHQALAPKDHREEIVHDKVPSRTTSLTAGDMIKT